MDSNHIINSILLGRKNKLVLSHFFGSHVRKMALFFAMSYFFNCAVCFPIKTESNGGTLSHQQVAAQKAQKVKSVLEKLVLRVLHKAPLSAKDRIGMNELPNMETYIEDEVEKTKMENDRKHQQLGQLKIWKTSRLFVLPAFLKQRFMIEKEKHFTIVVNFPNDNTREQQKRSGGELLENDGIVGFLYEYQLPAQATITDQEFKKEAEKFYKDSIMDIGVLNESNELLFSAHQQTFTKMFADAGLRKFRLICDLSAKKQPHKDNNA